MVTGGVLSEGVYGYTGCGKFEVSGTLRIKQYSWLVFCQNVNYIWVRNPMIVSEREEDNGLDCINMQNYFFYS